MRCLQSLKTPSELFHEFESDRGLCILNIRKEKFWKGQFTISFTKKISSSCLNYFRNLIKLVNCIGFYDWMPKSSIIIHAETDVTVIELCEI